MRIGVSEGRELLRRTEATSGRRVETFTASRLRGSLATAGCGAGDRFPERLRAPPHVEFADYMSG